MSQHQNFYPLGFQQIANLAAAVPLPSIPAGARGCYLSAETQDVRLRDDGTAPDAATGLLIKAGQQPFLYQGVLEKVQVIQAAAAAKLNISYFAHNGNN